MRAGSTREIMTGYGNSDETVRGTVREKKGLYRVKPVGVDTMLNSSARYGL